MYTTNRRGRSSSNLRRRRSFSSSKPQRLSAQAGGKFDSGRTRRHGNTANSGRQNRVKRKMYAFDPTRFINTNPIKKAQGVYAPKNSFATFGLSTELVRTITSLKIASPTPIQDQIIPEILEEKDVIGIAETGTGKTAAFLIPLIEKTLKEPRRQTLILAPTRELAIQIDNEFKKLSRGLQLFSVVCVGGIGIYSQIRSLHKRNHFVIGTPGRILDLIRRKDFLPKYITAVVLDEADRMLDMGFIHDMRAILGTTPKDRETHLFSATISKDTEKLANDFLKDPVTISVKKQDVALNIEQDVVHFKDNAKFEKLIGLLRDPEFKRVLIFGSMKHGVEKLAKELSIHKIQAESIHGNKNHSQRQRALAKFKSGNARILVATDVAARGIHIENVTHVINYDLPNTFEDYVHRIGRTGRAEKRGKALTFVSSKFSS